MKRILLFSAFLFVSVYVSAQSYVDHRGHNLDSLELAAMNYTADKLANADDSTKLAAVLCWDELANGYLQMNGNLSIYYDLKILEIAEKESWLYRIYASNRRLGQHMWASGMLDSAAVYYKASLEAVDRMAAGATSLTNPDGYSKSTIDDAYASLYGTIGNLHVDMEKIPEALEYYQKAGEIFQEYGWINSLAVLHNNMGELYLRENDCKQSLKNFEQSLAYGREANDSLWIATPLMGMSEVYMAMGKTSKALKYAVEADKYFSANEDQEFLSRIETLEVLSNAYKTQKKTNFAIAMISLIAIILIGAILAVRAALRKLRKESEEAASVLDETIEELRPEPEKDILSEIKLNDREQQILELLRQGKTTPQIAEAIFLSPETVKWYRKKLLAKFDASNTAELIAKLSN